MLTFADPWVAEVYESSRRDELVQAIFRCRPFDVPKSTQLGLLDGNGERHALNIVLLTAYPIAGLRVDELRFTGNAALSEEANARMDEAVAELARKRAAVTARSLAEAAATSKDRASEYLQRVSPVCPPTCKEVLIQVGGQGGETQSDSTDLTSAADAPLIVERVAETSEAPSAREPCRGGCGMPMPPGQQCVPCAERGVDEWLLRSRQPQRVLPAGDRSQRQSPEGER